MSNSPGNHKKFMLECFRLAEKGKGSVSPNPLVGAVLVRKNRIVARGHHARFGGPHAEVECLRRYKGATSDTTLYSNLEPCTHYGKTPPCTDLIIQRGIERVVVGMKDPNPLIAGKGIAKLRKAGVDVVVGILEKEARHLNRFFTKHIMTKIPYVHLKIAQTKNGFISKGKGPLRYISSVASRKLVHHWRSEYDAVLVGAGTLLADNPLLNARLPGGRDPAVIILDGRLSVSGKEKVFNVSGQRKLFLCTSSDSQEKKKRLLAEKRGVTILEFPSQNGVLDLKTVLRELYVHNIGSILVEGGRNVFSRFVESDLVDELSIFSSPTIYGSGLTALTPKASAKVKKMTAPNRFLSYPVGRDVLTTGRIH